MKVWILLLLLTLPFSVLACAARDTTEYSRKNALRPRVNPEYVPDELLVKFREGIADSRISDINESLNVRVIRIMPARRLYRIKVPKDKSLEEVRQTYSSLPEVETVGLNYKIQGHIGTP